MTLTERLTDYYGAPDREQEQFVSEREKYLPEQSKNAIYQQLIETRSKRYGFPDVAALSKVFQMFTPEKETRKQYYWCICDECHTEFSYSFLQCPTCFIQGKNRKGYKLKVSDNPPPPNVVRYNITTLSSANDVCINCPVKSGSYCEHFGKEYYFCDKQDFDECQCKKCCLTHKKRNS